MNITHGEATHRTGKGFLDNSKLGEAETLRETNARARKGLSTRCHGAKMHKAWSRPRPAVSRSARRKDFHVPLKHLVCCVPRPPVSGPFQEHVPRPGVRRCPGPPGQSSLSPKRPVLCLLGPLASRLPCRSTRPHLRAPFKSGFLRAVSRDPQPGASCPLCLHHLPLGLLGRGRLLSGRGCPMPALGPVGGWELHGLLRGRNWSRSAPLVARGQPSALPLDRTVGVDAKPSSVQRGVLVKVTAGRVEHLGAGTHGWSAAARSPRLGRRPWSEPPVRPRPSRVDMRPEGDARHSQRHAAKSRSFAGRHGLSPPPLSGLSSLSSDET